VSSCSLVGSRLPHGWGRVTCAPERSDDLPYDDPSKAIRSHLITHLWRQLNFRLLTFRTPFPSDQLSTNISPSSCKMSLEAVCCRCLPFHLSRPCNRSCASPSSDFGFHLLPFSGLSIVGVNLTEGMCNERTRQPCHSYSPLAGEAGVLVEFQSDPFIHFIVVLAVRTYAVWNKDKRVGIGLALLLVVCLIPGGVIVKKFLTTIHCRYRFDYSFSWPAFVPADAKSPTSSHRESIPSDLPRVFGSKCQQAHFRMLGGFRRDGRKYVNYRLTSEGFILSTSHSCPCSDGCQRTENRLASSLCNLGVDNGSFS
jgi:hypothetical protein